ncbi:trypsin-like serine protease [Streptomyces sp. SCSIO 30461]|uniref:trypsin-like serine protease n=1 Tax=Streptomyces sp. SCSIO 30461 TaxID=3118085 RepID=UPI00387E33C9
MAALLTKGKGSALKRQFCCGSLISANVVMTAAHCVTGMEATRCAASRRRRRGTPVRDSARISRRFDLDLSAVITAG